MFAEINVGDAIVSSFLLRIIKMLIGLKKVDKQ